MTSKLVPIEPTPEMMAAAAMAVLAPATADMALARQAAMIVTRQTGDLQDCMSLEHMAAIIATMAPAYRAMIGAAPALAQEQGESDEHS
jgi:hypothetical protein